MLLMGLDVGGSKIEVVLIELDSSLKHGISEGHVYLGEKMHEYKILARERIQTEREKGYEYVIHNISALCRKIMHSQSVKFSDLTSIGLGLPGSVHPKTQEMINGNSGIFIDKRIVNDLQQALEWAGPIYVANDANCFALAETLAGAGAKFAQENNITPNQCTGIGIILGTGVGGGLVMNGKIFEGKAGGALEIGHSQLYEEGHPCYCGRIGCAEQYLSGPALEGAFSSRMYSQIHERPKSHEVFQLATQFEPVALAIVKQYRRDLARFLVNLNQLFDPDFFILGGGVSIQDAIYESLERMIVRQIFLKDYPPKILKHQLGDSAGVLGAAFLGVR